MTVFLTYEDRPDAMVGVNLLARSIQSHCPGTRFLVYSPHPRIAEDLAEVPNTEWIETHDLLGRGWNAKPEVLLRTLDRAESALWLDSDIILIGSMEPILNRHAKEAILVATEYDDPAGIAGGIRSRGFGLPQTRILPRSVNTGAVRVTRRHRHLLAEWRDLVNRDDYIAAQKLPSTDRPHALVGDQDALWAVLSAAEEANVAVEYFELGRDKILDSGASGYRVGHRIAWLRGARPAMVHFYGSLKPWNFGADPSIRASPGYYGNLTCFELSPYFDEARRYADAIGRPRWLERRTLLAKVLNAVFLGNTALRGMPLAAVATLARKARSLR